MTIETSKDWGKEPPTEQGWYFYRRSDRYHPTVTFVEDCGGKVFRAVEIYETYGVYLDESDVEWWPEKIQVPPK